MRIGFRDDDLRRLYEEQDFHLPRFGADVVKQFRKKVFFLYGATDVRDLYTYRALRFEKLAGDREGQHSIRLNDQWRLILEFAEDKEGQLTVVVEIVDYH